jgi:hypothetical protein
MDYRLVVISIIHYLWKFNGRKPSRISTVASRICNGRDGHHSGDNIAVSVLVHPLNLSDILTYKLSSPVLSFNMIESVFEHITQHSRSYVIQAGLSS